MKAAFIFEVYFRSFYRDYQNLKISKAQSLPQYAYIKYWALYTFLKLITYELLQEWFLTSLLVFSFDIKLWVITAVTIIVAILANGKYQQGIRWRKMGQGS